MVFLSIIVPFNISERYLVDCLNSLSEQNLDDYEIILVVNGYDASIRDILNDYDLNFNVLEYDDEIGVAKARNEALKIAQGEYVYFIDGDDYIYRDGLSKLIENAKSTGADLINGERINTAFIRDRVEEQRYIQDERQLLKEDFEELE